MKKYIAIDSRFVFDTKNINDISLLICLAIIKSVNKNDGFASLSPLSIGHCIFRREVSARELKSIKEGLQSLLDLDMIKLTVGTNITRQCYYNVSKLLDYSDKSFYLSISKEEFNTIIDDSTLLVSSKRLRYFLALVSTFDASQEIDKGLRYRFGHMYLEYSANLINITSVTARKYRKYFEEKKLIFIVPHSQSRSKTVDSYCRYEDRFDIELFDREYRNLSPTNANIVNRQRKYIQKYNCMINRGTEYPIEEVKIIFEEVLKWNHNKLKKYKEANSSFKPKLKDLAVFKKYGLKE